MNNRIRAALYSVVLGVTTSILLGCLVPERFDAEVVFREDGSYTFNYAGTVVFAMALSEQDSSGRLPSDFESELEAMTADMKREPGFKKAIYKGNARYDVLIEEQKGPGEKMSMFDGFFEVRTDRDGVVNVKTMGLSEKNKSELEELGLDVNGTFEVSVPDGFEVIAHDADATPSLLRRTYKWEIDAVDDQVNMKIRVAE